MGSVTSVVLLTHILNKRAVGLPVADPELANGGGAKVEPRRREYRGAEGAEGWPPPQKFF